MDEFRIHTRHHQGDFAGEEVQTIAADLRLAFQTGKIIKGKIAIFFISAFYNDTLDQLCQKVLVMKGNECPFVF